MKTKRSATKKEKISIYSKVLSYLINPYYVDFGICVLLNYAIVDMYPKNLYCPTNHMKYKPVKMFDELYWFPDDETGNIERRKVIVNVLNDLTRHTK